MKINWGLGITISIILFTIITLCFVYFAFNQEVNLVRDDYYEAELNFDNKMEVLKRTKQLSEELKITLIPDYIELAFPEISSNSQIRGNIFLYRPSDRNLDIEISVNPDSTYRQKVSSKDLKKGLWKIHVDWNSDSTNYFTEKIIMVQ